MAHEPHYALYGNVVLCRVWCEKCQEYSIVLGSRKKCCGGEVVFGDDEKLPYQRMSCTQQKRSSPGKVEQARILHKQKYRCVYCKIPFGTYYSRDGESFIACPQWDHFVPYDYSQNNDCANFVAACQACNAIKSNKMFPTLEKARKHVKKERKRKGIKIL